MCPGPDSTSGGGFGFDHGPRLLEILQELGILDFQESEVSSSSPPISSVRRVLRSSSTRHSRSGGVDDSLSPTTFSTPTDISKLCTRERDVGRRRRKRQVGRASGWCGEHFEVRIPLRGLQVWVLDESVLRPKTARGRGTTRRRSFTFFLVGATR